MPRPAVTGASLAILVAAACPWARAAEPIAPTFQDLTPAESADATYAANAYVIAHLGGDGVVNEKGSSWRPLRGLVYRISVDRDVFFNALGRPDLAEAYLSRHRAGRITEVVGYTSACAGVFVTFAGFSKSVTLGFAGLGMLIGGAITREVGVALLKPQFPEDQALDMAARYNQSLRAHLGLAPVVDPAPRRPDARASGRLTFVPLVWAGGAGVVAGGRF
jgi:hypothetical protein